MGANSWDSDEFWEFYGVEGGTVNELKSKAPKIRVSKRLEIGADILDALLVPLNGRNMRGVALGHERIIPVFEAAKSALDARLQRILMARED